MNGFAESDKKIRIALIDDHTLFRSGLKALLTRQSDLEIVGEAADGLEGEKLVEQKKPDLVLLDLDMPVMNGHEALEQILGADPNQAVLMLTVSEDGDDLAECMRLGARGYLLKKIDADFLLQRVRHAVAGDSVISPEMTSKLVMKLRRDSYAAANAPDVDALTPREREILAWLARGVSNKEIARALDLAESTVKVHVQSVLSKLNIKSRVQAAVFAVENNMDKLRPDREGAEPYGRLKRASERFSMRKSLCRVEVLNGLWLPLLRRRWWPAARIPNWWNWGIWKRRSSNGWANRWRKPGWRTELNSGRTLCSLSGRKFGCVSWTKLGTSCRANRACR